MPGSRCVLLLNVCSEADISEINQACLASLVMKSEPFIFARSLDGLSSQLREFVPLFRQLQRFDRPSPKLNGFENAIGWDWEALVQAYNAVRDLCHSSSFAIKEYAIDALDGFCQFAGQIGLNIECLNSPLENMEGIEREKVDMDESGSVTDFQSAWAGSARSYQNFVPPLHSNFATTSAGGIAKPAPPLYQVEPVRSTSDDLADTSSDFHSAMDLDYEAQSPPSLPLPSRLFSLSEQKADPPQPVYDPSQFDSSLSSILPNTDLGQQAQAAARQAPAQDTSLTPIQESEEEYEPPEFFSESEEEYEPPESFEEVGRPSAAEG